MLNRKGNWNPAHDVPLLRTWRHLLGYVYGDLCGCRNPAGLCRSLAHDVLRSGLPMHEEPQPNQKFVLPANLFRTKVLPASYLADLYVACGAPPRYDLRSHYWLR